MAPRRRPPRWLLPLAVLACQPAGDEAAESTDRIDRTDERLAAIEAKLGEADAKLGVVAEWATMQLEAEKRRVKERETARLAREQRQREREARREQLGPPAPRRPPFDSSDPLDDDATATTLDRGRAIEGAAEGIQCEESFGAAVHCTIDRAFLDRLLASPTLLAKQARIVPAMRDGEVVGYKLYGIRRDTLPKLLTLENGDMITAVNDNPLNRVDEALTLYSKLREEKRFDVEIERKGRPFDLQIDVIE